MNNLACLFPGQGSQSVGMGQDLCNAFPEAKQVFDLADAMTGRSFSKLCFEGPESELKRTINTQPAILTVSLAAWASYKKLGGPLPQFVAGHSLGEITALVAAGALDVEAAFKLVDVRARLMEKCPKGAMAAVIGVLAEELKLCAQQAQEQLQSQGNTFGQSVVLVANFNTYDQLVLSGSPEALIKAVELAKAKGGKAIHLPVGGAFHSPLMRSAASEFGSCLDQIALRDAQCFVVQNYDAQPAKMGSELKETLKKQMDNPVHWCETIESMLACGVNTFVEIGPGKILTGMVKKIDKSAKLYNIFDSQSLRATISSIKGQAIDETEIWARECTLKTGID